MSTAREPELNLLWEEIATSAHYEDFVKGSYSKPSIDIFTDFGRVLRTTQGEMNAVTVRQSSLFLPFLSIPIARKVLSILRQA
jgi:hypothetical protein